MVSEPRDTKETPTMAMHWTGTIDHALIDKAMPKPNYVLTEQLVLPVPPEEAFDAISTFDLADVRQPAVRAAVRLGRLPGRLLGRRPTRLTLDYSPKHAVLEMLLTHRHRAGHSRPRRVRPGAGLPENGFQLAQLPGAV
jgi:hypothetical protein